MASIDGGLAALVLGRGDAQVGGFLLFRFETEADGFALARDLFQRRLDRGRFLQPLFVVADEALLDGGIGLGGLASIVGVPGELLVAVEAEDLAQHLLAFGRGLHGELVGASLHEEDAVDEGLVIHVEAAGEFGLRLAGGAAGNRTEAALPVELEEVERSRAPPRSLADDAIAIGVDLEVELDAHLVLAFVDTVILDAAAGFPPEGPGDGVEEGGLAFAVAARERGHVEAREVKFAVAVGEEVPQAQAARDHGVVSAGARSWACQRTPEASRSTTTATP